MQGIPGDNTNQPNANPYQPEHVPAVVKPSKPHSAPTAPKSAPTVKSSSPVAHSAPTSASTASPHTRALIAKYGETNGHPKCWGACADTPAQRHASAMKRVRTECARREITQATCAKDGYPFG
jgi:hypothetical protein